MKHPLLMLLATFVRGQPEGYFPLATRYTNRWGPGLRECYTANGAIAMAFGDDIKNAAQDKGASAIMASNAVWPPAVTCGFIANIGYCIYKLTTNNTWSLYVHAPHHTIHHPPSTIHHPPCAMRYTVRSTAKPLCLMQCCCELRVVAQHH